MHGHEYTARFEAPGGKPVLHAYPDPLTGKEPWTIGVGHTGPDVHKDTIWSYDRCMATFYSDYAIAETEASHVIGISAWALLNECRRAVLTDMCFQMGKSGVSDFVHMLAAIRQHDWPRAKSELLDSDYAKDQTPSRASMNAAVLLTGKWPEDMALS